MPLFRRRPLMRAAMVGGAAYAAGKRVQRKEEREAGQDQAIDDLQARQATPAAAPPAAAPPPASTASGPAAGGGATDTVEALTKLKALLDAGVLTQDEFTAQKQKILQGG